ncbi:hypothetical protein Hanom_Chr08g00723031 [Helianthus anomalus]
MTVCMRIDMYEFERCTSRDVCMYVYMYNVTSVRDDVDMGVCKDVGRVCTYVDMYVCMCKDMYECMHVCKDVGKVCMYVDVNVCSYVSTYVSMI